MKPNTNQRRSRGRSGSHSHNSGGRRNSRNQNFESNGPEVKVRGSAQQVLDKYLQFARDAQSSGDRVKAEGYLQFAEHYYRIVNVDQDSGEAVAKRSSEDGDEPTAHRPADQNQTRPADQNQPREPRHPRRKANGSGTPQTPAPVPVTAKNEATLAAEGASANVSKTKAVDKKPAADVPAETPKDTAVAGE